MKKLPNWKLCTLKELDVPSNIRNTVLKLPYKFRERWRSFACDLQERNVQRAVTDLVYFIEKHIKIASDPILATFTTHKLH